MDNVPVTHPPIAESLRDPEFRDYYTRWLQERPTLYPPELTDSTVLQLQRSPFSQQLIPYDA
eukprot:3685936-Prorocentrum_lima.AAC.1